MGTRSISTDIDHPLDPLTAGEIETAIAILRDAGHADPVRSIISMVLLEEPPKASVREYRAGDRIHRRANAVWIDRSDGATLEATVVLDPPELMRVQRVDQGHAAMTRTENGEVEKLVKQHPEVLAALARRGITDPSTVEIGTFPAGNWLRDPGNRRVVRTTCWMVDDRYLPFTGPLEGLVAIVDLAGPVVLEVVDNGVVPPPAPPAARPPVGQRANELRRLVITQPEGPSFDVSGQRIDWQGWSLRVGFNAREGMTLHTVTFAERPLLYRASFTELVAPYGDPDPNHSDRSVFDFGEANIGRYANHLALGCDCVGVIRYLDAVVSDDHGTPQTLSNAICIHEEDAGVLYKHTTADGSRDVRRSRRLVVSWFATLDNYDYGFFWYFYQDGSVECEVKLTGIVLTKAHPTEQRPEHGELVAPGLSAMLHQHIFNVRLDVEVDGPRNAVVEQEWETMPKGEGNVRGNAFRTRERLFARESESERLVHPMRARTWKVVNREQRNGLGGVTAYTLLPGDNTEFAVDPTSSAASRAGFARSHFWVTRFEPDELYAAGPFPNLHPGGAGLPAYVGKDRSILDEDIVVWYSFVFHHVPRPEDWPVMPVSTIGFMLKPTGFFDRNPALDLPAPSDCHHDSTEA